MSILHEVNQKSINPAPSGRGFDASASPLGIYTDSSTPFETKAARSALPEHISKVVHRYALQSEARRLLLADFESDQFVPTRGEEKQYAHRTCTCCRALLPDTYSVDLLHYPNSKAGGFGGLMHCSCLWTCPVCGSKISERRRELLTEALSMVANPVIMVTLTLQHKRGDSLVMLRDVLLKAHDQLLTTGKAAAGFCQRWNIIGRARGLEPTYGANGWHPHIHASLMLGCSLSEFDADAFTAEAKRRWVDILDRMGGYASWEHGLVVTLAVDPSYIAKLGFENVKLIQKGGKWSIESEMTKGATKQAKREGLTPLMLLAASLVGGHVGDQFSITGSEAGRLWIEYAAAMFRQQHLVTSGKIRELLKLVGGDKTDVEIEQEETEIALLMGRISKRQWLIILGNDARGELTDVLAMGDADALISFLRDFDIDLLPDEPEPEVLQERTINLDTLEVIDGRSGALAEAQQAQRAARSLGAVVFVKGQDNDTDR